MGEARLAMKAKYDALVIGTGFGGAVTACRLSQVKKPRELGIGVIERGRRYAMNTFPRDFDDIGAGWLWQNDQGLFDIKPLNEMTVVQGAGLGGGSLIYANVHVRPPAAVFENGWPPGYNLDALAQYYDLVAYMLDINPISTGVAGLPAKTTAMQKAARLLNREAQFFLPNIAVDLSKPGVQHQNKFDSTQSGCTYCGECDIGCNIHAKNTLDLNYLAVAEKNGAEIATQCEVIKIEPKGDGYKITFRDYANDLEGSTEADRVFVCAGAVNSTELLLRCRDEFGTLPRLNGYLGHRYSGNGDFLAFAFNTKDPIEPSCGPVITTAMVFDRHIGDQRVWFLLEEGGYPPQIAKLVQLLNPKSGWLKSVEHIKLFEELQHSMASAFSGNSTNSLSPSADQTAVLLAMGRDRANGIIKLIPSVPPEPHRMWIHWDVASNLPLYDTEAQLSTDIAKALGGNVAFNPSWKIVHIPVAVHNLGGCPMSSQHGLGVTDPYGEVYDYRHLYVFDGAILPGATGVNPSQTIAAVAERNVEAAIREITNDPKWVAPEMAKTQKLIDPISNVAIPKDGTALTATPPIQLTFTETMRGFVQRGFQPPDYQLGYDSGNLTGTTAEFKITITTTNLDEFLHDRGHKAIASGSVRVKGITDLDGSPIRKGIFNLFVADQQEGFYRRKMLYHLPFTGQNDMHLVIEGFKDVRDHGHFDIWRSTTTLYTVVREVGGPVVATGILRISLPDFLHQLTTFKISGTRNLLVKTWKFLQCCRLFFGTLFDLFFRSRLSGA
jgi:cholesterol oxidase